MKRNITLQHLLIAALALLALVGCSVAKAAPPTETQAVPSGDTTSASRYITVVGSGQVSLIPDVAQITAGAEASAGTVADAKAEVDRQLALILAALVEQGIVEKDIQTSSYSIYFEREPFPPVMREGPVSEGQGAQGAYRVSSTLNVTVRDIEAVGDVLDAVVEAGANQVYGVQFTVEDDQAWQSKARELAVADARKRAQELATLSGVELGNVLSISEVVGSAPIPMAAMALERGGGIAPGELELGTQIQVTFAIN